jgi:hypothetical protein
MQFGTTFGQIRLHWEVPQSWESGEFCFPSLTPANSCTENRHISRQISESNHNSVMVSTDIPPPSQIQLVRLSRNPSPHSYLTADQARNHLLPQLPCVRVPAKPRTAALPCRQMDEVRIYHPSPAALRINAVSRAQYKHLRVGGRTLFARRVQELRRPLCRALYSRDVRRVRLLPSSRSYTITNSLCARSITAGCVSSSHISTPSLSDIYLMYTGS